MTTWSVIRGTNSGKVSLPSLGWFGWNQTVQRCQGLVAETAGLSHPGPFSVQHQCDVGCCGW